MQFVEVSDLGLRSAVYEVKRHDGHLVFVLFCMSHVGTAEYYRAVRTRLETCDFIFAEGVASRHTAAAMALYRAIERTRRLGLVTQKALDLSALGEKVVQTDMSGEQFDREWKRLPLSERALLFVLFPLMTAYVSCFGTRERIARHQGRDDLPSREEVLAAGGGLDAFFELIDAKRDRHLAQRIVAFEEEHRGELLRVAVLYGAAHMRALTRLLLGSLRYHVIASDWLTVFEL